MKLPLKSESIDFKTNKGNFGLIRALTSESNENILDTAQYDIIFFEREDNLNYWMVIEISNLEILYSDYVIVQSKNKPIILGFVKDISDKDWKNILDISKDNSLYNYETKQWHPITYSKIFTIQDSVKTLLNSLQVYTANPYLKDSYYENCNQSCLESICSCDLIDKQNKAEDKVNNWILIKYN